MGVPVKAGQDSGPLLSCHEYLMLSLECFLWAPGERRKVPKPSILCSLEGVPLGIGMCRWSRLPPCFTWPETLAVVGQMPLDSLKVFLAFLDSEYPYGTLERGPGVHTGSSSGIE